MSMIVCAGPTITHSNGSEVIQPYKKQDENEDNKNDKPFANLLFVDDDPDIAHVLKQGFLKNRFWLVPLRIQKRHKKPPI
jgi:hypothetical protein